MKEGWTYKKLGDIAEIKGGKRLPKGDKLLTTPTKHPYIRVADFNDLGTIDTDDIHYISDSVYEQIKRYIIKKEDVYISIAGTIGKSGIIPDTLNGANLTENACRLILSNNVDQRYVYYFTISPSFIKQIYERTKKSAQPKLALTRLSDVIISYPTIKEQQSIVDYLDSAFAKIDAMKANAEKALNEAKALFQASLKEMLEPKEGWEEKKFGDVCWYNKNNGIHKGTIYIGMEHIEQGTGKLLGSISSDDVLSNTFAFNKGDVLYGRLRPYLKKVIVADFDGCCSTEIFPIQSKNVLASFLMYWFLTDEITNKVNSTCAGCRMPRGNMNDVLKFDISYPSFKEQQNIVTTLDSLKFKVDRLQENYNKISQECDALKQAILRQVFE